MLTQPDLTLEEKYKSIAFQRVDASSVGRKMITQFSETFNEIRPEHEAAKWLALEELYNEKRYINKVLEIICYGETADSLCDKMLKTKADIESTLITGHTTRYPRTMNLVGLVNDGLNAFEMCSHEMCSPEVCSEKVTLKTTKKIRAVLENKRINLSIANTSDLEKHELEEIKNALQLTIGLWENHKKHFVKNTGSLLSIYFPPGQIKIDDSPVGVPTLILIASEIEEFKEKISPEVLEAVLSRWIDEGASLTREEIRSFSKKVFEKNHFTDLHSEYCDALARRVSNPFSDPAVIAYGRAEPYGMPEMPIALPPRRLPEGVPQVAREEPRNVNTTESAKEPPKTYLGAAKRALTTLPETTPRNRAFGSMFVQQALKKDAPSAKISRTSERDIPFPKQPPKQSQQMSLRKSASSRHLPAFDLPPAHVVVEEEAILEQRVPEPPKPPLRRSASTLRLGDTRPVAAAQELAEDVSEAVKKKPGLFQRLRRLPTTVYDYVKSKLEEKEKKRKIETVVEGDEGETSDASADGRQPNTPPDHLPATKKKRKKTKKSTAKETQAEKSDKPYSDEAYLAEQMEQVKIEKAKMPETSQQQPSTSIDLPKNKEEIPELIKEVKEFLFDHEFRQDMQSKKPYILEASDVLKAESLFQKMQLYTLRDVPKAQQDEWDLRHKCLSSFIDQCPDVLEDFLKQYSRQIRKCSLEDNLIYASHIWEPLQTLFEGFRDAEKHPSLNKFIPLFKSPCERLLNTVVELEERYSLQYQKVSLIEEDIDYIKELNRRGKIFIWLGAIQSYFRLASSIEGCFPSISKQTVSSEILVEGLEKLTMEWEIKEEREGSFLDKFIPLDLQVQDGVYAEAFLRAGKKSYERAMEVLLSKVEPPTCNKILIIAYKTRNRSMLKSLLANKKTDPNVSLSDGKSLLMDHLDQSGAYSALPDKEKLREEEDSEIARLLVENEKTKLSPELMSKINVMPDVSPVKNIVLEKLESRLSSTLQCYNERYCSIMQNFQGEEKWTEILIKKANEGWSALLNELHIAVALPRLLPIVKGYCIELFNLFDILEGACYTHYRMPAPIETDTVDKYTEYLEKRGQIFDYLYRLKASQENLTGSADNTFADMERNGWQIKEKDREVFLAKFIQPPLASLIKDREVVRLKEDPLAAAAASHEGPPAKEILKMLEDLEIGNTKEGGTRRDWVPHYVSMGRRRTEEKKEGEQEKTNKEKKKQEQKTKRCL